MCELFHYNILFYRELHFAKKWLKLQIFYVANPRLAAFIPVKAAYISLVKVPSSRIL